MRGQCSVDGEVVPLPRLGTAGPWGSAHPQGGAGAVWGSCPGPGIGEHFRLAFNVFLHLPYLKVPYLRVAAISSSDLYFNFFAFVRNLVFFDINCSVYGGENLGYFLCGMCQRITALRSAQREQPSRGAQHSHCFPCGVGQLGQY